MSDEAVAATLASNDLQMDEIEVIASLRDWANVNSVVLGRPVNQVAQKIVSHIRLPLLTPEELSVVEKENEKDHLLPVSGSRVTLIECRRECKHHFTCEIFLYGRAR